MVGAKRDYPFEHVGRGPAKVRKEDTQSIYEATLNKLKHGALASLRSGVRLGEQHEGKNSECHEGANSKGESRAGIAKADESVEALTQHGHSSCCYVCTSISTSSTCYHCTRRCCATCSRICDGCQGLFCSICCTANYDERNDRSFCFECKNGRAPVVPPPVYCHCENLSPTPSRFRQSTLDFLLRSTAQRSEEDQSCCMEIL